MKPAYILILPRKREHRVVSYRVRHKTSLLPYWIYWPKEVSQVILILIKDALNNPEVLLLLPSFALGLLAFFYKETQLFRDLSEKYHELGWPLAFLGLGFSLLHVKRTISGKKRSVKKAYEEE